LRRARRYRRAPIYRCCLVSPKGVQGRADTIIVEENTMGKGNNAQRKEVKKKKAKKDKPKPTSR
jgi:hypothetical protein